VLDFGNELTISTIFKEGAAFFLYKKSSARAALPNNIFLSILLLL
jgi:hypothetical protein